jgi:branched-chain amino acid transport system substrate-binding protein
MNKRIRVLAALLALAGAQAAKADVKIGFLGTLTGSAADVGRDQIDGFALALEQLGNKLGGVSVTLFKEDDQQKPEIAVGGVAKLLDRDKVDVVIGLTFASSLMAIQSRIAQTDVPFIGSVAGPSPTAGAQCKANLFITSWNSDAPAEAVGKYLADKGVKRISTLTANFVGGKDKIAGLKRFYKGEIADELYTALNQLDFSAELTSVANSKDEAIYAFYPGSLGVSFVRQYGQAGQAGKVALYTTNTIEGDAIDAMGAAAIGTYVADTWTPGVANAQSKQFVAAFEKRFGRTPSAYAAFTYDTGMLLDAALRATGGKASDRKALTKAIATAQFHSVRGEFHFGRNNYPIQNYHIYQIVRGSSGKPEFKLVAENVLKSHADAYAAACPLH